MSTAVFLQARLDSRRLPRKALIEIKGKTVIEHAMANLMGIDAEHHVLVTEPESVDVLGPLARGSGYDVFVGSKDDVLSRYANAARAYEVETIVRATGDNPLVSAELAELARKILTEKKADFCGLLGMPLGTGVEVVKTKALLVSDREAVDPYEREHVNPFLYRRPERFVIVQDEAPESYRCGARVTLDTSEDLSVIRSIYDALYRGRPIEIGELVAYLKRMAGTDIVGGVK